MEVDEEAHPLTCPYVGDRPVGALARIVASDPRSWPMSEPGKDGQLGDRAALFGVQPTPTMR